MSIKQCDCGSKDVHLESSNKEQDLLRVKCKKCGHIRPHAEKEKQALDLLNGICPNCNESKYARKVVDNNGNTWLVCYSCGADTLIKIKENYNEI